MQRSFEGQCLDDQLISAFGFEADHAGHQIVDGLELLGGWWDQDLLEMRGLAFPAHLLVQQ
jgi:hypothetical protein